MKLIVGFILSEVGEEWIAVPIGAAQDQFHGIIRLNKTGKDIWNGLSDGLSASEIAARLTDHYEGIDIEKAEDCVRQLCQKFRDAGILQ